MKNFSEIKDVKVIGGFYVTDEETDSVIVDQDNKVFIRKWL